MRKGNLFAGIGVAAATAISAPIAQAQSQIVHDAEFVRMQQQFGKQWQSDDALVREKLAALEKRFACPSSGVLGQRAA